MELNRTEYGKYDKVKSCEDGDGANGDGPDGPAANISIKSTRAFKNIRRRAGKNLVAISVVFLLTFTALNSLQNLQSSLNDKAGLGLSSLSVLYGCLMISCIIAPFLIRSIGPKWTTVICSVCYSSYTLANFYPEFYTLIPAAAVLGFAAGPFWVAQGTYLTSLAVNFAEVVNEVPIKMIHRFTGIFFLIYQSCQIWGNMLSSLIFSASTNITTEHLNDSHFWTCGRNGTGLEGSNFEDPGDNKRYILLSLYVGLGLLGALVGALFMDNVGAIIPFEDEGQKKYFIHHLLEVVHLMYTPHVGLLIPVMIYSGSEQAYIYGDFTKAFVSCTAGVHTVGFVMIAFGVANASSCFLIGHLEHYVGRVFIFTAGGVVNFTVMMWMLFWTPSADPEQYYQLYLMAVGWGFTDAVWQSQISAILSVLLHEGEELEAAFANFRFWQSLGFVVSFTVSVLHVQVFYKLLGLIGLLALSMLLYYILEYLVKLEKKNKPPSRRGSSVRRS